jgi:hypothetical protein
VRAVAPLPDHRRLPAGVVPPHRDHRKRDHLSDLPGDRYEHVGRRRPAAHDRRETPQRGLLYGEHLIPLALCALAEQTILDVGERHDRPAPIWHVEWCRRVRDAEHGPVATEEPIEVARDRFAGRSRAQHRALRGGIGTAVGTMVVNRRVAVPTDQLVRILVPERSNGGGVGESD